MRVRNGKYLGLALVLSMAIMAATMAPSAGAAIQHHKVCRKVAVGTGPYDDPKCLIAKGGIMAYATQIVPSSPEKFKVSTTTGIELEWASFLLGTFLIDCEAQSATGEAWNPEPYATSNGKGEVTLTMENCSVLKPSTACVVTGGEYSTQLLDMALGEAFGPGATLAPSEEIFAEVTLEECAWSGTYVIKGSTFGIADNENSLLEFTNETSSLTLNGGAKVLLRGESILADSEGNSWSILP